MASYRLAAVSRVKWWKLTRCKLNEYILTRQERDQITADELAMRILAVLQRNHKKATDGSGWRPSYGSYQLFGIRQFEFYTDQDYALQGGIEPSFGQKFNEAVQILKNANMIVQQTGNRTSARCLLTRG